MDQLFSKQGNIVINKVPTPEVTKNSVLVLTQYSLISTGTERSTVKSTGTNILQMAMQKPEEVKKVLAMVRERGIRNTYQYVQSVLKGFYEMGNEIGYSAAGIVIDVGENVRDIKIGDRVACAGAGIANHAEIIRAPRNLLVKIPEGLDFKKACSVTLGAIALQGVRQADVRLGEKVAVVGLGLLGQITIQLLKASGCNVIGSDIDERKIGLAKKLGIDNAIDSSKQDWLQACNLFSEGRGLDTVIITAATPSSELINQAADICRKKGRIVIVGDVGLELKREKIYKKELEVRISCSYGPGRYDPNYEMSGQDYPYGYVRWTENRNMQAYLDLLQKGKVLIDPIITQEFDFSEAAKAYEFINNPPELVLGIVLKYPEYKEGVQQSIINNVQSHVQLEPVRTGLIRVGVIGCGGFAMSMHLPNLKKLSKDYHLQAVADRNGAKAELAARQFEADYSTTDADKIFEDENIDLVMICTRHSSHADLIIKGIESNKAVFVEKPLAINQAQLDRIKEVYNRANNPLVMLGFNRRYSPLVVDIKKFISNRKNPIIINYRMNAGYIPLNHWVHTEEGGGRIIGEACHIYDLFKYLTDSQHIDIAAFSIDPQNEIYSYSDNTVSTIKYKDGSVCNLIYTALGSKDMPKEYCDVFCDGKIYSLLDYKELIVYGGKGSRKMLEQDKGHLRELEIFAKDLKTNRKTPIDFESIIETTEISFQVSDLVKIK